MWGKWCLRKLYKCKGVFYRVFRYQLHLGRHEMREVESVTEENTYALYVREGHLFLEVSMTLKFSEPKIYWLFAMWYMGFKILHGIKGKQRRSISFWMLYTSISSIPSLWSLSSKFQLTMILFRFPYSKFNFAFCKYFIFVYVCIWCYLSVLWLNILLVLALWLTCCCYMITIIIN